MATLTVPAGTTRAWGLRLRDADGHALADTYAGSEPLTLKIWSGDDRAPVALAASGAAWLDAATGKVQVTLHEADTALWAPGLYRLRVLLTDAGQTYSAAETTLAVTASPGTATAPASYATLDDVRTEAPWVDDLVTAQPAMQANLAEYLARSRADFDAILQRHYARPATRTQTTLDHILTGTLTQPPEPDAVLQAALDADGLDLTGPTGTRIRRWCALRALADLCGSQLGKDGTATDYQIFGRRCRVEATCLLPGIVATVDLSADEVHTGLAVIDLAAADTLRG